VLCSELTLRRIAKDPRFDRVHCDRTPLKLYMLSELIWQTLVLMPTTASCSA
jgi:hypothetical protein